MGPRKEGQKGGAGWRVERAQRRLADRNRDLAAAKEVRRP
jgi:hypothetical protein